MVARALLCAALLALAAAPAAHAAFPGDNGAILWTSAGDIWSTAGRLTATPEPEAQAAWEPYTSRIAYRVGAGGTGNPPYRIAVAGTPIGGSAFHETQPGWSPDGRRIVFRRSTPGQNFSGDVWSMNADGSDPRPLVVTDGLDERYPALSPDGTRLAFTRGTSLTSVDLWVADADGSDARQITFAAERDSAPSWSPDGMRIAFERGPTENSAGNEIWTVSAAGGDERRLTTNDLVEEGPSWSPDGTQIAFTRGPTQGEFDIWRMDADGTDATPVHAAAGGQESSDWQAIRRSAATPPAIAPGEPAPGRPVPGTPAPPTAPSRERADRDRDGLALAVERRLRTSDLDRDSDDDGLSDGRERLRTRTSPRRFDTDRDGRSDGYELGVTRAIADPPGPVRGTARRRFRPDPTPRTTTDPLRAGRPRTRRSGTG